MKITVTTNTNTERIAIAHFNASSWNSESSKILSAKSVITKGSADTLVEAFLVGLGAKLLQMAWLFV